MFSTKENVYIVELYVSSRKQSCNKIEVLMKVFLIYSFFERLRRVA